MQCVSLTEYSDGEFIDFITTECDELIDIGHLILLGDFNIDVSRENHYSKRLLRNMKSMGLKQYVQEPTRVTKESKTIIDLVFSNFYVKTDVLITPKITDRHIFKLVTNKDIMSEYNKTEFYKRDFTNFDKK